MNDEIIQERALAEIAEVSEELMARLYHVRQVLKNGQIELEALNSLASYIVTIRSLLDELGRVPGVFFPGTAPGFVSISELQERYLELEGIVKEMRNERCQTGVRGSR